MPRARVKTRIRVLFGSAFAIGPGKADLLQAIAQTGSISAAARSLGMSYRRAWLLIDTMNQCFREPVVDTATGGRGGGGARITASGVAVLRRYRGMEAAAAASVARHVTGFDSLLRKFPPTGKTY
jgi:molybdate transport system regulatory protein